MPALEVDWLRAGFYSGDAEGPISEYSTESGRDYLISSGGDDFEQDKTGRITVILSNQDDRYTWSNTTSPLYPNVHAGKRFRLRSKHGSTVYPLALGVITDIVDYQDESGGKFVRIEGENHLRTLRNQARRVTIPLQENVYSDDVINAVLTAINWPYGKSIQSGNDVYPYWWSEGENAGNLIYGIAHAEMGNVYLTADGTLTFRSRYDTTTPVFDLDTGRIDLYSLKTTKPSEIVRTLISCQAIPIYLTDVVTLYELTSSIALGVVGSATDSVEVWGDFTYNNVSVSARSCIEPVAYTDWTANSVDGGGGTDLTGSVTLGVYFFSSRFKITLKNNSLLPAYVLYKVRGNALVPGNPVVFEQEDTDSVFEPSEFIFASRWMQSVNLARQMTATLFKVLTVPRAIASFDLVPDDMALMFGMDIGLRGNVDAPELGLVGSYRIIKVIQSFVASSEKPYLTNITIEPVTLIGGGGSSTLPFTLPAILGA
jgi:hypothetical protein